MSTSLRIEFTEWSMTGVYESRKATAAGAIGVITGYITDSSVTSKGTLNSNECATHSRRLIMKAHLKSPRTAPPKLSNVPRIVRSMVFLIAKAIILKETVTIRNIITKATKGSIKVRLSTLRESISAPQCINLKLKIMAIKKATIDSIPTNSPFRYPLKVPMANNIRMMMSIVLKCFMQVMPSLSVISTFRQLYRRAAWWQRPLPCPYLLGPRHLPER